MLNPTKCVPQRGADLHQLEARFDLFDEHVDLDRRRRQPEMLFERGEDVVPERRFFGGLNLWQIQDERCGRPRAARWWLLTT